MVSINELVEEALINSGINDSFRKSWKRNTKIKRKESIVSGEKKEVKDNKKKVFEHNFNSFEDLKNHIFKKEEKNGIDQRDGE